MFKKYSLILIAFLCVSSIAFGQTPWINEIHYDNSGADANEGVEVAIPTGYTCSGTLTLTPYNGSSGAQYSATPVDLGAGMTSNGVTFYWTAILGLQNGAPDGIALSCDGTLIQFLSYEGTFLAINGPANGVTSTSIGVQENGSNSTTESLQLQGTGCQYSDFTWAVDITSTNDDVNTGQTISCSVDEVDWCNLQFPEVGSITTGGIFDVYGQVYEAGVTPGAGQGAGITAWVGYSTTNTNPNTWTNWVLAGYNAACADCNGGQNDEYFVDIGAAISTGGTYYYTTRFQLNGGPFRYGGILADGSAGDFWDGTTYISGMLTITDPPVADVVITEIMYNTTGTDDEWIEICNISGSVQDISNYIIDVSGTTEFTFPASTTIANGTCITVSLGDNGAAPYNPDCPFTPDYSTGLGTDTLSNTNPETITLYAANGSTVADVVTYDDSDGADGNTASLHVTDATLDNSNASSNWQEVLDGGTAGFNILVSSCTVFDPEINVEGFIGGFPNISDGDTTPSGLDNTLFAQQIIGNSQLKSFRIQNLGNVDLVISNIFINGANPGDFTLGSYSYPFNIAPGANFAFDVTFSPLVPGVRNATVNIDNDDADEDPYDFAIRGSGVCAASAISISPASGPSGTVVNVTGSNFGTVNTAANIDGLSATVIYISATEIEVIIPAGANPNNLIITDESNCLAIAFFTVLTTDVSTCEGASGVIPPNWNDLLITGVFDNAAGSCHYLELFNPTASAIALTAQYEIGLSNNYATTTTTPFTFNAGREALTGDVLPYSTFVIRFGNQGDTCNDCPTIVPDQTIENPGFGINGIGSDGVDRIVLIKNFVNVDLWGNDLYASAGYVYTRSPEDGGGNPVTSTAPTMSWDTSDWASQGTADCFGFQYQPAEPPLVTLNPSYTPDCDLAASFIVSATEGYDLGDDSQELAYQWFYHAPGDSGWTSVTNGGDYSGSTTTTLSIINVLNYYNYQYYCQIREDDANCFISSDASRLELQRTIWTGSWSNGAPDINTIAVIDGLYLTDINGNIDACNLIINSGAMRTLDVKNSTYVRVVNNVINNGTLIVQTHGAFVQDGLGIAGSGTSGTFTNNGTTRVIKETELLNDWYEYTYWSSPVVAETIDGAFPNTPAVRRFWFDSSNYLDQFVETNNDNGTLPGQDDIDDDGNDWTIANGASTMIQGLGYAATSSPSGSFPGSDQATFESALNTGDISIPIIINGYAPDNDWNFIGNPYASAIDFDDVYTANSTLITGAAFLWSHALPPDPTNNGNENWNFNQNDYAIITIGSGNTAGGSGIIPAAGNFIPSAQGFFVTGIANGNLTFNNDMRRADTSSNNQFFEAYNPDEQNTIDLTNRLWINLTSDNGVFNQILLAYVDGATNGNDGMSYDAARNLSSGVATIIYSFIEGEEAKKYAIQGFDKYGLNIDEVIPIGFYTSIEEPTIYKFSIAQLEGLFLEANTVYIKDKLMGITHNLSDSDYSFTSDIGEFNDRFEIVFTEDALSLGDDILGDNDLIIIEGENDDVLFKLLGNYQMASIEIIDMLGRTIYNLDGEDSNQVTYDLSGLSQATYIVKVTLTNGKILIKKAIKRK